VSLQQAANIKVLIMAFQPPGIPHENKPDHLLHRIEQLRAALRLISPLVIAERTGAVYSAHSPDCGEFNLRVWDQAMVVSFPELSIRSAATGQEANPAIQALMLYYFQSANGTPLTGRYIAYSELPDGRFYSQAFQGYTGDELVKRFGNEPEALQRAAGKVGGIPQPLGDVSYVFHLLPHITLLLVYWQGDEDFPANCQILFDAAAATQLPADVCAIAGSMLTRKLLASF
jgi:hypothetical protein